MITSCIILNYNDSKTTKTLLDSIKNYDELDFIVIVDNCSTDNSLEDLTKYETNKIKVISAKSNGGYGAGNNYGIKYAIKELDSHYILISNPDVMFENTTVKALKDAFKDNRDCAIIAPSQIKDNCVVAWKLSSTLKIVLSASLIITKLFKNYLTYYNKDYFVGKDKVYVDVVAGSLLMVNAAVMLEHGMYDEEMFLYFEEIVLAQKLKNKGYKSLILMDTNYQHYHSVSVSKTFKSIVTTKKFLLDNEIHFFEKYRNIKGYKLFYIKLFFKYILFETWIYSFIMPLKKSLVDNMEKS